MEQTTKEAPLKAVDAPTDEKISTQISYDDFSKIQLRVGQVMTAEKIEKSEKLLKLAVDLGEGKERQIIAGLAKYYTPETIVGRKVAVVANLKPAKLMGLMSEGMILASDDDGKLAVMGVDPEAKVGSIIK